MSETISPLVEPYASAREFDKLDAKVDLFSQRLSSLETAVSLISAEQNRKLDLLLAKEESRAGREKERDGAIKLTVRTWTLMTGGGFLLAWTAIKWVLHVNGVHP